MMLFDAMRFIGSVSGEGGPFIIADAVDLQNWSGIDGPAYGLACALLDLPGHEEGGNLTVDRVEYFLWEIRGGGTVDLYQFDEKQFIMVRTWPHDPKADSNVFTTIPRDSDALCLGNINVRCGFMGLLWAPENGRCIQSLEEGRPTGDMALNAGGWVFRCKAGYYSVWHDEVKTGAGSSRRCWIECNGN